MKGGQCKTSFIKKVIGSKYVDTKIYRYVYRPEERCIVRIKLDKLNSNSDASDWVIVTKLKRR